MTEKGGQSHHRENVVTGADRPSQGDRQESLRQISEEGDSGRLFPADTQHIGGTGVAGALGAGIGEPEESAGNHRG